MPDICDLILDHHELSRRRFAELDELHGAAPEVLQRVWGPLADFLDLHAAAEEAVFYPELLRAGADADEETEDAIGDHNEIRDAVADSREREPGSDSWWEAVQEARKQNGDHLAEEERGALADFRRHTDRERRAELGAAFERFCTEHAGLRGLRPHDTEPEEYIEQNS